MLETLPAQVNPGMSYVQEFIMEIQMQQTQTTSTHRAPSPAWRVGYDDASYGKSEYDGYSYFAGEGLQDYFDGYRAGQYVNQLMAVRS